MTTDRLLAKAAALGVAAFATLTILGAIDTLATDQHAAAQMAAASAATHTAATKASAQRS